MNRVALLPRLSPLWVDTILEASSPGTPAPVSWSSSQNQYSSFVSFAATGGSPDPSRAADVADALRGIAFECGFPNKSSSEARSHFDCLAAIALATEPVFLSGEGLRDDVWAFLTTVLAPDVVAWRFTETANSSRFSGGVRNAFQRLWIRGSVLDRGEGHKERWFLLQTLTEDAMVQIFERASIASNERVAKVLAEEWVETVKRVGRGAMEDVMRTATKLIRLRNEVVDLAILDDEALSNEVKAMFTMAVGRK